ncbi:uncharacterized protein LOC6546687 [Drosophila erecta]|uniref:Uncharacterized protein n=1 Tax=Drosophila erecta TaxID=7220 RepID=B3NS30_DROER|nr:uncharacterized protein LOC6546687 [Drosophila erecta]EDV56332.1 uncharacterized protein Dere_GG20285 [Drosophila erecta]
MKFFAVLVCFSAVLGIAMAGTPTTTATTPTSPPTSTSPTYPTSSYSYSYPSPSSSYTYTDTTTAKPVKQQILSLLFNKKSG